MGIAYPKLSTMLGVAILGVAAVSPALAATCAPPAGGARLIRGVVREATDGATLCIQTGADPARLTRIRLADVQAPPLREAGGEGAKWRLRRAVRGKRVSCMLDAAGVGMCTVRGLALGAVLRTTPQG